MFLVFKNIPAGGSQLYQRPALQRLGVNLSSHAKAGLFLPHHRDG